MPSGIQYQRISRDETMKTRPFTERRTTKSPRAHTMNKKLSKLELRDKMETWGDQSDTSKKKTFYQHHRSIHATHTQFPVWASRTASQPIMIRVTNRFRDKAFQWSSRLVLRLHNYEVFATLQQAQESLSDWIYTVIMQSNRLSPLRKESLGDVHEKSSA